MNKAFNVHKLLFKVNGSSEVKSKSPNSLPFFKNLL